MEIGIIPDTAVSGMGIKRYSLKLIEGLSKRGIDDIVVYYSSKRFENELIDMATNDHNISPKKIPVYFGDSYFGISFRNFFQLPKTINESKLELIHDTYSFGPFVNYPFRNRSNTKKIINVHDVGVYLYKYCCNYVNPLNVRLFSKIRYEKIFPLILKNVDGIAVPSENTKKDLLKYFDVPESKLFVINHGIDFNNFHKLDYSEISNFKCKYINFDNDLLIGTINSERKIDNIHIVLKVTKMLSKHYKNLKLILIGKSNKFVDEMIQKFDLEKIVIKTGYISDKELCLLYNALDLFIFLSEYEGFGFPPLESMSCGTLTAVLNKSSLPELVDEGAVTLLKKEPKYILDELIYLLENKKVRDNITKKGIKRAKYFTWDKCIDSTVKMYESILTVDSGC
ncbi:MULTISPECIES: glycosyltransferase family 4 protein [Methanobacterium]|uniref:Glycosyltransferase family 1 protein n=1 Tax=Methanobacterium veterum TaxID=408577 RepID=A0A9E5A3P2_9EURY|nr:MULTISPECIES: glycosyltransferase family 1 protein [Methanobacterium]MCZ3367500.1 glycosyltransferase family 1 protein [Methanobacterium veterum]MCZ3373352.1 glycosyltransferase family 1 protein [Methanobacterium veterum]